ncbi:2-dehydropantoate 2-reductase [Opitutales bacterium ASA1]|uniref:2-dehydropantoate 2-reductase n=1 Tax=Congregicoccus parvus TaxID=3081749 RepID=UPI002B2B3A4B|nr:2-dehydropantoate 2-reductase [Opitutales bacterium ASA1]
MSIRIALIGPGAIGGTLAAHLLSRPEIDLTIIARTPFDQLRVEQPDGSALVGTPPFLTTLDAASAATAAGPFDWIFVAVKAYDAAATAPWLAALLGPSTRVAIIQNGVEHRERFAPWVPASQLLPVMVDLPAERTAPGRIRQRGPGLVRVPADDLGHAFVALFAGTPIDAATSDDFTTVLWRKLTINSHGAINALLLRPNRALQTPAIAELARAIMLETIAVARAEGARLDDALADTILDSALRAAPDGVNSLHADRAAGRRMEASARNGAVVRAGLRHGIPTPFNLMATTLLEALQPTD